MADWTIRKLEEIPDVLGDYPGEMRMSAVSDLGLEQVGFTWRRMPAQSGGKGSYGHRHKTQEEVYFVASGTLEFKLEDEVVELGRGTVVRVPPHVARSVWNEGPDDAVLIVDLVRGSKVTESAASLLASGALIWLGNAIVFGLLYWELDSGGPLARYERRRAHPDFAFSQQLSPELAPPGWRPRYVDYLVLGITTSTAFSPTDVMPMKAWAKLTMAMQSLISLTVIGLVIARAVNAFQ